MLPKRFDTRRLAPVHPGDVSAKTCSGTEALIRACRLGAGPATRPFWQPWLQPHIEWPYGVFHVADAEVARRACLQLDGTWQMEAETSAAGRWRIRLAAQGADAAWWRPLAPQDAWDAGHVRSLTALEGFQPRRPSLLLLAQSAIDEAGLGVLARIEAQAQRWPRAVRLVVTGGPPPAFARALSG